MGIKASEYNDSEAMCILGRIYEDGYDDLESNDKLAFKWYKKSAENGNVDGMFFTGYAYNNGIGIDKDIEKAIYWYEQAADKDNSTAMDNLAYIYQYGEGIAQNYEKQ